MSIKDKLKELDAPRKVLEAADILDDHQRLGLTPPREFVQYVDDWLNRNRGNDRYGK
jgi:hypothetical protein